MKESIQRDLALLESSLPELQQQRSSAPFANDVYEAIDDWYHFGRRAVENDTRVNYPIRDGLSLHCLLSYETFCKPNQIWSKSDTDLCLQQRRTCSSNLK